MCLRKFYAKRSFFYITHVEIFTGLVITFNILISYKKGSLSFFL